TEIVLISARLSPRRIYGLITLMIHFVLNHPAAPDIYPLSLHDALPISWANRWAVSRWRTVLSGAAPASGSGWGWALGSGAGCGEIGRASCRERVESTVVASSWKRRTRSWHVRGE